MSDFKEGDKVFAIEEYDGYERSLFNYSIDKYTFLKEKIHGDNSVYELRDKYGSISCFEKNYVVKNLDEAREKIKELLRLDYEQSLEYLEEHIHDIETPKNPWNR